MAFRMLVLSAALAIVAAHPPTSAKMHEAITSLVTELDSTHLTLKKLLKFNEQLSDQKVAAGEKLVLKCDITSIPSAVFEWTFNGNRIQGDKDLNIYEKIINVGKPTVESGMIISTYTIPCASSEDAGEYKCIAYNGHESLESVANVVVEGENTKCKSTRRTPPTIVQWSDSRFEMESNTATLLCRTNKPAEFAWQFEGEMLNAFDSRYEIMPNGDLVVRQLVWDDMGTYTCIASNKYGEERVETFLYPTKKKST